MREWGNSTGENRERNNEKNKGRETKEDRGIQIRDIHGNKRRRDPEIFRGQEKGEGQEDNSKIQDKKWNEDEATLDETGRSVYKEGVIIKNKLSPSLADILEDTFNIVICLHMVVSTIPLCTSTYQMLLSFARLEKVYISTFLTYFCFPLCTLCGYCYTDDVSSRNFAWCPCSHLPTRVSSKLLKTNFCIMQTEGKIIEKPKLKGLITERYDIGSVAFRDK
ncbi:odorant receptor 13a-like, partial [Vespula squamosa]